MHFHLTFSGLVCILSLWEAAGAMSFYDPFEGTETNRYIDDLEHQEIRLHPSHLQSRRNASFKRCS